jgi:hypothetical protein
MSFACSFKFCEDSTSQNKRWNFQAPQVYGSTRLSLFFTLTVIFLHYEIVANRCSSLLATFETILVSRIAQKAQKTKQSSLTFIIACLTLGSLVSRVDKVFRKERKDSSKLTTKVPNSIRLSDRLLY